MNVIPKGSLWLSGVGLCLVLWVACSPQSASGPEQGLDVAGEVLDSSAGDSVEQLDVFTREWVDSETATDQSDETDSEPPRVEDPLTYVDPFIGTGGEGFLIGSGTPAVTLPYGMVKVGPDTMDETSAAHFYHCSGYWYPDNYVIGFSQIHVVGTGAPDYGVLLMNPVNGISNELTEPLNYRHSFKKANEEARAGYYAVQFDDGIVAELAATKRVAFHRYRWSEGERRVILLDLGHALKRCEVVDAEVTVDPENGEAFGWVKYCGALSCGNGGFDLFFSARFDGAIQASGTFGADHQLLSDVVCQGKDCGAYLDFGPGSEPVGARVGVSFVSVDGARNNLLAEANDLGFDEAVTLAEEAWREKLNAVQVIAGGTDEELRIFFTSLYHTFVMPNINSDADGQYLGMDLQVHDMGERTYYSDFSIWDTYRTLHPLLTLLDVAAQSDMVASLVRMYDEGGAYPRWPIASVESGCMIGTHADIVVADSYLKDIPMDDPGHAFDGLLVTATGPKPAGAVGAGRADIEGYLERGYCAVDRTGSSVSWTMEVAHDDYALSRMAQGLGRSEEAEMLLEHSKNYAHLWKADVGFFQPKNSDGSWHVWDKEFDPIRWEDWFTEGNSYHYLWYVPHDVPGLAELMGGADAMLERLEEFFALSKQAEDSIDVFTDLLPRDYYWHGNEPDMATAYLFSALGRQDLAARWVRWIMRVHYHDAPQGYPGNDDCGTMSSWYVFSALGFFPIPGTQTYYLGKPLFEDVTVQIQGHPLRVLAQGPMTDTSIPVQTVLNGELLTGASIEWEQLRNGGELKFILEEPTVSEEIR